MNNASQAVTTQTTDTDEGKRLVQSLKSDRFQSDLASQLPKTISVERFTATTIVAIRQNPDLLMADRTSLYNAIMKASAEGLMPDGNDGVLNVYNVNTAAKNATPNWIKKVQWQRMVGGIIKQFAKAGINAYVVSVYKNEPLEVWNDGDGQHVKHSPILFGDRGERIGALAVGRMPNGTVRIEAMNMDDLGKAKAASKSPGGPWTAWPERMEQKSCLHRLRKRVAILDPDAEAALKALDDEFEDDEADATPAITIATQRPAGLQAALDTPATEGQTLPGKAAEGAGSGENNNTGDII
jgi:recombination protein RecT